MMSAALLKDILKGVRYSSRSGISRLKVKKVTYDSRAVAKGDLFIAVKGHEHDGHDYIKDAAAKGAAAIAAENDFKLPRLNIAKVMIADMKSALPRMVGNFYGHPSKKMRMIGVTGTNGKTTTTYLIENILASSGARAGVIGTINYRFADRIFAAKNTTPGPVELQSMLAEMVSEGLRYAIMEVSSHSLDQGRVDGVLFDRVVFTNVTSEHLDYHKTLEKYFKAKVKIFDRLKKGGTAVLNMDDKRAASLSKRLRCSVITYGLDNHADVTARISRLSLDSTRFAVKTPRGELDIETSLIGRHNISNILAAVAVALSEGVPFGNIRDGVRNLNLVPGRLEPIKEGQNFSVFVDFAHTADALYNILRLLREVSPGRLISVFGCGGNRDKTKRPEMGRMACKLSDRVIITSDNPRHEDPSDIIRDIEAGVKGDYSNYETIGDRRLAIRKALEEASAGDVVVIAGKGHEKYQIIKDKFMPFDDCDVVRSILNKARIRT